jgi:4-diphosphocytidyl-2-C-methyl-D-erythritol kinase
MGNPRRPPRSRRRRSPRAEPVTPTAFAAAKVNLFLHVGSPLADGRHPLCSLVVFADLGDSLAIEPADALGLAIDGPFAGDLGAGDDNLALRAAKAVLAASRGPQPPFRLRLTKQLPVAAGLGGGSSDAGAALRLVRDALGLKLGDEALEAMAADLGSDGTVCLHGRPALVEGRGERLGPAPLMPPLDAVLVNPGLACPTAAVFQAFDRAGDHGPVDRPEPPDAFESAAEVAAWLALRRNDLEAPASLLVPQIGEVLDTLRGEPETLLGRLSGSGATAFALCGSDIEAEGLAERLGQMRPNWWIRRCRLGGPWD